jgi:putative sigma-54 modulation protein
MKFNYVGQDVEVTDAIKGYIEKKFQKIKRPLNELQEEEIEVHVGLRKERAEYRVDVDVYINQTVEKIHVWDADKDLYAAIDKVCLLYTSPSPRDRQKSRMPSSA